ncbi:MAG: cupredoxin family copper-binding protein [Candidatus Eremiobacteraeota bacterium]|nr:cupredoxin family copper-binding protein [Candidatus Eremiobacteraeota bacterium]
MKRFSFLFLALLLTATAAAPSAPEVHIRNDAFNPPVLTVEVGQSVTFTNNDDDAHTVTATDGTFDSKGLDTNGVWRHAFTQAGTYRYFCQLHPFMKGTIVVKARGS